MHVQLHSHPRFAGRFLLSLGTGLVAAVAFGAPGPSGAESIRNIAGCFNVTYNFVEDGAHDYFLPNATELVRLKEEGGKLVLQHYGIFNRSAMKHWREDWSEAPGGKGLWTQKVVGPFGDARYECTGAWEHGQWSCDAPNAPKPLRDKQRKYARLDRHHTLQTNPKRWIQVETNVKKQQDGSILTREVGWIEYTRVADDKCAADDLDDGDTL